MHKLFQKQDFLRLGILFLLVIIIFTPSLIVNIFHHSMNDYDLHLSFARSLVSGEEIPAFTLAHPFWQAAVITTAKVLFISLEKAAAAVQLLGYLFLALVLYLHFKEIFKKSSTLLQTGLLISLLIAAPIFLLVFADHLYYLGYIGITTYHNPTINLLKPFALILLTYAVNLVQGKSHNWKEILLVFLSVVISTLVKPSFIICLIPALGILVLYRLYKKEFLDWRMLIIGMAIPSALILLGQYYITYLSDEPGVIFAPLAVMKFYSDWLLLKLILSIWFPLLLAGSYFKDMLRDNTMRLTWLVFLFGLLYTYFIAEDGNRFQHGNFGWSGEISMFLLFVNSVRYLAQKGLNFRELSIKQKFLWLGAFSPHVVCGIIYYVYCLTNNTFV